MDNSPLYFWPGKHVNQTTVPTYHLHLMLAAFHSEGVTQNAQLVWESPAIGQHVKVLCRSTQVCSCCFHPTDKNHCRKSEQGNHFTINIRNIQATHKKLFKKAQDYVKKYAGHAIVCVSHCASSQGHITRRTCKYGGLDAAATSKKMCLLIFRVRYTGINTFKFNVPLQSPE